MYRALPRTDLILVCLAIALGFSMFWGLMRHQVSIAPSLYPLVGEIVTSDNIFRRHTGSLVWMKIRANRNLHLKDFIFVPPGEKTKIRFLNNTEIELTSNTMIQLDEFSNERVRVTLMSGQVATPKVTEKIKIDIDSVLKPKPYEYTPMYPAPTLLKEMTFLEKEQNLWIEKINEAKKVNIRELLLPIKEIHKLDLLSLEYYTLKTLFPQDGFIPSEGQRDIEFKWESLPLSVNYVLEISQDPSFKFPLRYRTVENFIQLTSESSGKYFWRVLATSENKTIVSKVAHFAIPKKVSEKISEKEIQSRTPQASQYLVEIARDSDFTQKVQGYIDSQMACKGRRLDKGIYYCRILDMKNQTVLKEEKLEIP